MITLADLPPNTLHELLRDYGFELAWVPHGSAIPGSYWGTPEAGLIGNTIYARPDTPVHSLLHEFCHAICMDSTRREQLHTDAGGDDSEENAVCYLQILLTDRLLGIDRIQLMNDMDTWGYSFRLGSASAWFNEDAQEAREWLQDNGLIDHEERINVVLRE